MAEEYYAIQINILHSALPLNPRIQDVFMGTSEAFRDSFRQGMFFRGCPRIPPLWQHSSATGVCHKVKDFTFRCKDSG